MTERIIRPVTFDGKITIPKELRIKYKITDYVEFGVTTTGIIIKPLEINPQYLKKLEKLQKEKGTVFENIEEMEKSL